MNISQNDLRNIEPNAFEELEQLLVLDLSFNHLTHVKLLMPENIEHCSLAGNQLIYWPLKNMPRNMQTLELQENELTEMLGVNKNQNELTSLKLLNISRNRTEVSRIKGIRWILQRISKHSTVFGQSSTKIESNEFPWQSN